MLWKQIEIPGDSSREGLFIHEQSDCSEADGRRAETLTLCETLLPESSDFVFCLPGATQGLTPLRTAILKDPSMLLLFFFSSFLQSRNVESVEECGPPSQGCMLCKGKLEVFS